MPMKRQEYPDNWEWLSRQVRARNGGRCELCNAPNGEMVYRSGKNGQHPWQYHPIMKDEHPCKIILTVHHIDGNKMNSDELNLISLCQKCHLRLDLAKHLKHRKERKL